MPEALRAEVETLWAYHDMGHEVRRCDIGIGLGSHDLGVATRAAVLFRQGMFPGIVFTGANAPTTVERFPRGEAVHYREHAIELGVPAEAIRVETRATNTGENIRFTRGLLAADGIEVRSAMLVSRPYQQRRAYATARRVWPGLEVVCASSPLSLDEYVAGIGDARRVIEYPARGFAIPQEMPIEVRKAYDRLVRAGFTRRLLPRGPGPRPR